MRKIVVCIFLVLTLICSCSEKPKAESDWIEKEKALWDGKKYTDPQKAIEYLNNAIKLEPNNAETYFKRGTAYVNLRQYQLALNDFNDAIRLKPDVANVYNDRGVIYLMHGNKVFGCNDVQKACELGACKGLEAAKGKGLCR
jgi:tetratricopeptide (TPR) repeat protein